MDLGNTKIERSRGTLKSEFLQFQKQDKVQTEEEKKQWHWKNGLDEKESKSSALKAFLHGH